MFSYLAQAFDYIKKLTSILYEAYVDTIHTQVAPSFSLANAGRVWLK